MKLLRTKPTLANLNRVLACDRSLLVNEERFILVCGTLVPDPAFHFTICPYVNTGYDNFTNKGIVQAESEFID